MSMLTRTALPIVLLAAAAYAAPATAPATAPASTTKAEAPAFVADFSTPSATMKSLADAVVAHDMKTIKSAILVTDKEKDIADGLFRALDSSFHFQTAVKSKFGAEAAKSLRAPDDLEAAMAERRKLLLTAETKIDGATATMTFHPPADSTIKVAHTLLFHKTGDIWQIDASSMFGLDDPERAEKVRQSNALLVKIADLMDATAKDIEQSKLATMQEVRQTLMSKLQTIVSDAAAGTAPASAPATHPAPKP